MAAIRKFTLVYSLLFCLAFQASIAQHATNPIIYADVPDPSIIRVGDVYYMSSTTMHMSPGIPVMKSTDLVNWELLNYAYDVLDVGNDLDLIDGNSMYGKGSWASSLRYHEGVYYLSTFSGNTNKTYIYTTTSIEEGNWKKHTFRPSLHDHTLFFEGDKIYMIWGAGTLNIVELHADLSGIKPETERVLIENAHAPIPREIMLPAEGSQLFKINDYYYLVNIAWPKGGMRTVIIHRAQDLMGPYVGRVALEDMGVAQGGLIETAQGGWFAYLFRDFGAVGRIPYLVPVVWENDWPVLGIDKKVPMELHQLPPQASSIPSIVASDDFKRTSGQAMLPLVWQWNHNPANHLWIVDGDKGLLQLKTDRVDESFLTARNTLTQRTFGPTSSSQVTLHLNELKEGDIAGLGLLQKAYGWIGVKLIHGKKVLALELIDKNHTVQEFGKVIEGDQVHLKVTCDFTNRKDLAHFYFSEDGGDSWTQVGPSLQMNYTLPHFMGYRFALMYYATANPGGRASFADFRLSPNL
jgi:beta-xylosidase